MRIIGNIEHPVLKITVFKMDLTLTVQIEHGFYEQAYKFRQSEELGNIDDIRRLIDATFLEEVTQRFFAMRQSVQGIMDRHFKDTEENTEEII